MMKRLVLLLTLGFAACQPLRAATGDFLFSKVGSDGFIEVNITPNGTDLLGWDGSNNLVQIPRATWLTPATAASTYQLIIGDGDLTIARTSGLQTALDAKQPLAATLTTLSSATAAGLALMDDANATDQRATLGLTIGTNVQAYDPDLTTYAGITPSANVQSLLGAADYSAFRTALGLGSVATLNVSAAGNATNNAIPQLDATGRFITHNALGVADPGNLTRTGELAVDGVIFSDVSGSGFFQFITLATPTANRTHTLPDASGTLINTGNISSITGLTLSQLTLTGTPDGTKFLRDDGSWQTVSTGLTIGTTSVASGTDGYILYNNAGTLGQLASTGTGNVVRAASPTITGTLTAEAFYNSGIAQLSDGILYVHPSNPNVGSNTGVQIWNNWSLHWRTTNSVGLWGDVADQLWLRNTTRAQGVVIANTWSSTTSYETVDIGWAGSVAHLWTTKGSGGGTARDLVLGFDSAEKLRINAGGVTIGASGSAIPAILRASAAKDFDLTTDIVDDETITCTGAVSGDEVVVGVPAGSVTATSQFFGWVSADDTVTIRCRTAVAGENPSSGTFSVSVLKR